MSRIDLPQLIFWFYSFVALWSAITIYKTSIEAIDKKRFGECISLFGMQREKIKNIYGGI